MMKQRGATLVACIFAALLWTQIPAAAQSINVGGIGAGNSSREHRRHGRHDSHGFDRRRQRARRRGADHR